MSWVGTAVAATLTVGAPVEASIGAEPARFEVALRKGDVFAGWVDQLSVDVMVRIVDPKGRVRAAIDGPARGRERFTHPADVGGTWIVEVEGFEGATGRVEVALRLAEPEGATAAERARQRLAPFGDDEPGGAVAVVVEGQVVFRAAFGLADLSHRVPFGVTTPSNIGSMTKQLTAYVVLDLVREGTLDLDAPIGPHVPELPAHVGSVTLRQLLQHRSGLRDEGTLLAWSARHRIQDESPPLLRMLQAQPALQPLDFVYNNSGYELAALVAERASATSFEDLVRDRVFVPHGMDASRVRTGPYVVVPLAARGYGRGEHGWIEIPDDPGGRGAGGVYASVDDLSRWVAAFGSGLDGHLATMVHEDPEGRYGMGLFVDTFEGLQRVQHGGDDGGFHSMLRYFPEHDVATLAVVNGHSLDARGLADDLARIWLAPHLRPDPEPPGAPAPASTTAPWTPDLAALEPYAGRYVCNELGMLVQVAVGDGGLVLRHPFFADRALAPVSPDRFAWGAMGVAFRRDGGEVAGFEVDAIRSKGMRFERLP